MIRSQKTKVTEAKSLAKALVAELKGGEILALVGPLGSGKTTFTRDLAKQLKIREKITSPTFTLMNVYSSRLPGRRKIWLYHLDLYRTKNFREAAALGLEEIWGQKDAITV